MKARINTLLDQLDSAHLNTLFVASPKVGENCGWANRYAFEDFIAMAKERGFSLHLWIINKARADPTCNEKAQIDFTDPQEKYRQAAWVQDLLGLYANYLDGVHLDYIRYSDWEKIDKDKMGDNRPDSGDAIGVSATVMQIHQVLQDNYPNFKLSAAVLPVESAYASSHRQSGSVVWDEAVPKWYQDWFAAYPDSWYSRRIGSNGVPLHMKYQQDPVGWIRANFIDVIIPMNYTLDTKQWDAESDYWKSFTTFEQNNFSRVFMGLRWGKDNQADPGKVIEKIEYGRSIGLQGFVIFEFSEWDEDVNNGAGGYVDDTALINLLTVDSAANHFHAPYKAPIRSCMAIH